MDQVRLIAAIALSFAVLVAYEAFFVKKPETPPPGTQTQEKATVTQSADDAQASGIETTAADVTEKMEVTPEETAVPARTIEIETPLFIAQLNEKGGSIGSFQLKKYREAADPDAPNLEMVSRFIKSGTVDFKLENNSVAGLNEAVFQMQEPGDGFQIMDQPKEIILSWKSADGIRIDKIFRFDPKSYGIVQVIRIVNGRGSALKDAPVLSLYRPDTGEPPRFGFEGLSGYVDGQIHQIKADEMDERATTAGSVKWIAAEERYFISSIIPDEPVDGKMRLIDAKGKVFENRLVFPAVDVAPGKQIEIGNTLYFGPKRIETLQKFGHQLDAVVDFGWFHIIAEPCLWLMNRIYDVIPNFGIAIILLTILVKIILWPLGTKSYKSMGEMKKLQPLMAELREKHKNDKKRMNEELMGLYRTYKINPASGCLPMFVQLPVFVALYNMLYQAIELRHAPFFGWIDDLSAPDRLFRFGFEVPFMEAPYGIPVLTLVMGATMFLQQKMSPPAGDPTQAKVMMFMPVLFTFIFINFSSGLVLYWLVNNVLSIAQQYYIQKKYN